MKSTHRPSLVSSFCVTVLFLVAEGVSEKITAQPVQDYRPKIAIIGGGVGGTGVSYFLHELVQEGYSVDLYEKSAELGGRVHTVQINGRDYETGGSIVHPRNQYAKELVEKLNLRVNKKEPGTTFAILKDKNVVLHTSHWTVVTVLRILWRYGLGFNHLMTFVNKLIDDFSRIYELQSDMNVYSNPGEILTAMNPSLANLTNSRFRDALEKMGFQELLIEELIQAVSFVNYGQDTNIHAFVGMISMAGADDGLWSVENGNKQLAIHMAKDSKANVLLNATVSSIVNLMNDSYAIRTSGSTDDLKVYDIVVIANPLEVSQISFENFSSVPYDVKVKRYHRTVATIVAGILNENFTMSQIGVDSLFNCDRNNFFTSIGRIFPAKDSDSPDSDTNIPSSYPVYKIFSPKPLSKTQLEIVFSKINQIHVSDWFAYPEYEQIPEVMPPFILKENLYYVNSIEWAASAIEMSLISAKNIANLIHQQLRWGERFQGTKDLPVLDRTEL